MRAHITRRTVVFGAAAFAVARHGDGVNAGTRQSRVHDVSVNGFAFVPKVLEVHAGDIVRWTNHDLAPHTATADGRGWNTEEITQGQSAEIAVTAHMETSYFCLFHPHMKGRLIIVEI